MLSRGEVVGVFQVESAGMRKALIGMRPDRIEDIIALVALYRPGPMENIPTYNARKHGEEEMASIHPKIDHLVKETQGVIVYQEQVMQIAQELSGYSLGEADLLRRAMGKKIRAEMDEQRERFVTGAVERGVGKPQADFIFDLLAKFADYGFNKSHAAAYAIVSYQTAYLKAHYPVEFLAASMTLDMGNTDKLADFRQDALRLGIEVRGAVGDDLVPRISRSARTASSIRWRRIKGVGDAAVEHIVDVRGEKPFADLADFCERVDPKIVGKRVFESLIMAGALDCFGHDRAADDGRRRADDGAGLSSRSENAVSGQADIFGASLGDRRRRSICRPPTPWLAAERLHREFQVRRLLSLGPSARRIQGRAAEDAGAELGRFLGRRQARRRRRPACRHGHLEAGAQDAHRQQDGRRAVFRHVRPVRGGAVFRGTGAVSRPARARPIRRHHRRGRGPAGRHQPAHPDGAVAGGRGKPQSRRRCASSCATRPAGHACQRSLRPRARARSASS